MSRKQKILLVDDDVEFLNNMKDFLSIHNYDVASEVDFRKSMEIIYTFEPDAVVLDQFIGSIDVLDRIVEVRRRTKASLIVMSANQEPIDRIMMLEAGADEYIVKNMQPREILARIRASIRRATFGVKSEQVILSSKADVNKFLEYSGWRLEYDSRKLINPYGREGVLTPGMRNMIWLFFSRPGEVLHRQEIYDQMREKSGYSVERSVDNFVSRLRGIFRRLDGEINIEPVRSVGYKFLGLSDQMKA